MIQIGSMNRLKIVLRNSFEIVLRGNDEDEDDVILSSPPQDFSLEPGEFIEVFVFINTNQQLEATLEPPFAMVGEFAYLEVVDVQHIGAFLDWGLSKDLFVPHHEQIVPMILGHRYVVGVYVDNTGRIAASSKLDKFLDNSSAGFKIGQKVDLLLCESTDLGIKAIVDGKSWGLLYHNEIFEKIQHGQKMRGYIKNLRSDNKIDLSLKKPQFEADSPLLQRIVDHLKENGGHSDITDKSPPSIISETYGVSKSQYKNALGMLYRKKQITIEKTEIRLVDRELRPQ